jgi:hypothetical protein
LHRRASYAFGQRLRTLFGGLLGVHGGERPPPDLRIQSELRRVALVQVRKLLNDLGLGGATAVEESSEAVEVKLRAGGVLRAERPLVEDVREDEERAVAFGPKLEAKELAPAPGIGDQTRRLKLRDLGEARGGRRSCPDCRRSWVLLQASFECVQTAGPVRPVRLEPPIDLGERLRPQAVPAPPAVRPDVHQAGLPQHPEVLRDPGLAEVQPSDEVVDRPLLASQEVEDLSARRLCERRVSRHRYYITR